MEYNAIPSSVHLERGYCCNNGCVNCPWKISDKPRGCPSHDSYTEEMESMEEKISAAFTKGLIVGAIVATIAIIAGFNF
jgi:2-iminoacetate synthase ThiH